MLKWLMGCRHSKTTTPRRDKYGSYVRCNECAARVPWKWPDDFYIPPPRPLMEVTLSAAEKAAMLQEIEIRAGRKRR